MVDWQRFGGVKGPCPERQLAHGGAGSRPEMASKTGSEVGFSAHFRYFSRHTERGRAFLVIIIALPCREVHSPSHTKFFFSPPLFGKLSEINRHLQHVQVLE